MTAKDLKDVRKTLKRIGYNETTRKWSRLVIIMYVILSALLITDAFLFMLNMWHEIGKRIDILNGITMYGLCVIHFVSVVYNDDNLILLVKGIEMSEGASGFQNTDNQVVLRREINEDINRLNTVIHNLIYWDGIVMVSLPFVIIIIRVIQIGLVNVTSDIVYTVIPLYVPESHKSFISYFILILMQTYFVLHSVAIGYVAMVPTFNSMQMISGEIKLLTLMVKEMDLIIENSMPQINWELSRLLINEETEHQLQLQEMAMKTFLQCFVKQHCTMYRKLNEVTRRAQLVAFSQNLGFSILLCTNLYRLVKKNDMSITQDGLYCCLIIFVLYCYGEKGEQVSSEGENLRTALYECEWFDKPIWFRKSLSIIMTRANQEIEIKTFQVAVLGLKQFLRLVQGAYSYYNVLKTF